MADKALNVKKIIITLLMVVVIAVLFGVILMQALKYNIVVSENKNLKDTISTLNNKIASLSEKFNQLKTDSDKQSSELESVRNRLTQQNLKNVQLEHQVEEFKARFSNDSSAEVIVPDEAAPPVS